MIPNELEQIVNDPATPYFEKGCALEQLISKNARGLPGAVVYSQYGSGNRGTLAPQKRERRATLESTSAAADERRRVFYSEVMRSRSKRRAA